MEAYSRVLNARKSQRPMGGYFINAIFDNFIEMHGDKRFGDDGAIVGGIAELGGIPVTVIAMERGQSIDERMRRNFGCPSPEGYRKALRLMKQAEKFHRPVICFIGSSGAYCGIGAEERGQGEAIAENLMEMMTLKTPIVSVVVGEGGSGGALALGVADTVIMLENAVYSVISPEGCASILWKDSSRAHEAAEVLKLTAEDLYKFGIIEKIIYEGEKSAEDIGLELKTELFNEINNKGRFTIENLLEHRYNRSEKLERNSNETAAPQFCGAAVFFYFISNTLALSARRTNSLPVLWVHKSFVSLLSFTCSSPSQSLRQRRKSCRSLPKSLCAS